MKATLLIAALLTLALPAWAETPTRRARVATGATVPLAASARTPAQWTTARPGVRALRPRARGNFD
jgi:hypothetical protein